MPSLTDITSLQNAVAKSADESAYRKLFILFYTPVIRFAKANFVVKGTIGQLNSPAKVYLKYYTGTKTKVDSAVLHNGKFEIHGYLSEINRAIFYVNAKGTGTSRDDYRYLNIDKGTTVLRSAGTAKGATATGTQIVKEDIEYQTALKEGTVEDFIKTHPSSVICLRALYGNLSSTEPQILESLFLGLSPQIRNSDDGKGLFSTFQVLKKVAIGQIAPYFSQPDTSEKPIQLSSLRGKYVLLDFWASWCIPCRKENPNLIRLYQKYKDLNFTILGVSLDALSGKNDWLEAIKTDQLTWLQVSDLKAENLAAKLYGITAVPQSFLIDPNGKILGKNLKGTELGKKLSEILGNQH